LKQVIDHGKIDIVLTPGKGIRQGFLFARILKLTPRRSWMSEGVTYSSPASGNSLYRSMWCSRLAISSVSRWRELRLKILTNMDAYIYDDSRVARIPKL
jgi:hypothetical protein